MLLDADAVIQLITFATTPELWPFIFLPLSAPRYTSTSVPKWVPSNCTAKYSGSKVIPPGTTTDPSLNIWLPNCSTWFCRIDCIVVSSRAWTGNPGLNRTLWKFLVLSKSS